MSIDAGLRHDEAHAFRDAGARQLDQLVAIFAIGRDHRLVGSHGFSEALPALAVVAEDVRPGWRDEDAAVVAIGLDRFFDIRRHRQAEEAQLARASGTSRSKKTGPACARARWWERISQHGMSSAKAAGSRQGRARQPIAAWSRMTPRPASL